MKTIKVEMTGGTIDSEIIGDSIGLYNSDSPVTKNLTDKYTSKYSFTLGSPYLVASENMTTHLWGDLVDCIQTDIESNNYDAIIITTGTDTLAYTSSLLSLIFSDTPIPIILVSSNYVLSDYRSNGMDNFNTALMIIDAEMVADIYVPYRNSDGIIYIHRGCHLNQSRGFLPDFYSQKCFAKITTDNKIEIINNNNHVRKSINPIKRNIIFSSGLFAVTPYVGINYCRYHIESSDGVIHELYHSGSASSMLSVLKKQCDKAGVPLFVAPIKSNEKAYESISELIK